ncbi:MAG: hypothetical protein AAFQ98_27270, partial [Bacteroidota bacterium]
MLEGLTYEQSQAVWRRFQSTGFIRLINQDFQRFELVLTAFDATQPEYAQALTELTEIPLEAVEEVLDNLPIQVEESVSRELVAGKLEAYEAAGFTVEAHLLEQTHHQLVIEEIKDLQRSREILGQFLPGHSLPQRADQPWYSPIPIGELLARYAV